MSLSINVNNNKLGQYIKRKKNMAMKNLIYFLHCNTH